MEQSFNHFFNVIAERCELARDMAVPFGKYVLGMIVQRMHYTGAANLVAQLPHMLQDELLDLPAGPKRSITGQSIVRDTAARFGLTEDAVRKTLSRFWSALEIVVDPKELDHVKAQLPDDIREVFGANTAMDDEQTRKNAVA